MASGSPGKTRKVENHDEDSRPIVFSVAPAEALHDDGSSRAWGGGLGPEHAAKRVENEIVVGGAVDEDVAMMDAAPSDFPRGHGRIFVVNPCVLFSREQYP